MKSLIHVIELPYQVTARTKQIAGSVRLIAQMADLITMIHTQIDFMK